MLYLLVSGSVHILVCGSAHLLVSGSALSLSEQYSLLLECYSSKFIFVKLIDIFSRCNRMYELWVWLVIRIPTSQ